MRSRSPLSLLPNIAAINFMGRRRVALFAIVLFVWTPIRAAAIHGGPIAAAAVAGALLLPVGLAVLTFRSSRIEWDGQQVTSRSLLSRRPIGAPGTGQILRVQFDKAAWLGGIQFWLDASGRVAARLPETRWDPDQLSEIAEQARIPVVELGVLSPQALYERYPTVAPRLMAQASKRA